MSTLNLGIAAVVAISLLAGMFCLSQALLWRRIARRSSGPGDLGAFARELARAAAGSDVRYAWGAIGVGWIGLVALVVRATCA